MNIVSDIDKVDSYNSDLLGKFAVWLGGIFYFIRAVGVDKVRSGLATLKSAPNIITDLPLLLPNAAGCNLHSSDFKQNHSDRVDPVERKRHNQTPTKFSLNLIDTRI